MTEGTGRGALLGFTPQAGKTGTNQIYRDAWFMGFTGHYVTGVWFGNDDFTPDEQDDRRQLAGATWHDYNVAAHTTDNIAQIPGLALHPRQIEEMARIAEIKKEDPTLGTVADGAHKMPGKTRKTLTGLNKMFKEAKRIQEVPAERGASLGLPASRVAGVAQQ